MPEWRPNDPMGRLQWLLAEHFVRLEYGMAQGCRCLSCSVYRLSWEDADDKPRSVEGETLPDTVARAWGELEGKG